MWKYKLEVNMEDVISVVGHSTYTFGAWLTAHWSELGAAVLMILQGAVLIGKLIDRRRRKRDG